MNSRLNKIRANLADATRNSKKRKYEEEQSEQPLKRRIVLHQQSRLQPEEEQSKQPKRRPFLLRDAPRRQLFGSEEANVNVWGQKPQEHPEEKTRRYSANNRLKRIRRSIEQSRVSPEMLNEQPSTSLINSKSDGAVSSTSTNAASSPRGSYNCANSFNTAKPSSLDDRIKKFNKYSPQNDQHRKSACVNTAGGGWFKSVDVEGPRGKDRQDRRMSSSNINAGNLSPHMPSTTGSQNINKTRIRRTADDALFFSNKNSNNHNTPTFDDNNISGFSADSLPNNVNNNMTCGVGTVSNPTQSDDRSADAMDWDSIDEEEVVSNLQELRKNTKIASAVPQTSFQQVLAKEAKEMPHNNMLFKTLYLVVDTNIFLSHLDTVKKAMQLKINGVVSPVIFVPWIVIQELDYIKDGKREYKLKSKAQKAIHFINDCLCRKENLKGQSVRDAAQQDFASSNFDDGILHCCLQIRERRNRAMLLSNDVNLRNKLINEDFETYSHDTIFKELDPFHLSFPKAPSIVKTSVEENGKIKSMKTYLSHMCTFVILKQLKNAYGELWNKMGSTKKKLPWSLEDCLELFEKYWIPVFQMNVPKQCQNHIETFNKSLKRHDAIFNDAEKLLNFGLTLCVHLKVGYPCYFDTITECIDNMQKVYDGTGG